MGFIIKLIPNAIFNTITFFREVKPMDYRSMQTSTTSVFRKSKSNLSESLMRKDSKRKNETDVRWFH